MLIDPAKVDRAMALSMGNPAAARKWTNRAIRAATVIHWVYRKGGQINKLAALADEMGVSYGTARRAWADLRRAMESAR